ncbi:hypothetical protein GQ53DRAFT_162395 [Thozetella sp. PMI_491]|nr:hypothetical protein GQ53DRAFT_162395 [Thozetella sp. PMI_491]
MLALIATPCDDGPKSAPLGKQHLDRIFAFDKREGLRHSSRDQTGGCFPLSVRAAPCASLTRRATMFWFSFSLGVYFIYLFFFLPFFSF